jgi:signal transduction histidine kinase/integral membrane sensor domain MASE1
MNPGEQTRLDAGLGTRRLAVRVVLFAVIALVGNQIGSVLRYPHVGAAVLFPPYAATAAALVVSRRRDWMWYVLVASATHLATHWPQWSLTWVLIAEIANVVRALVAAILLQRALASPPRLDSIRKLSLFIVGAVVIAPAVGATIGASNTVWHGGTGTYEAMWRAWFMSNALTGLTMLPAFMAAFAYAVGSSRLHPDRKRVVEALLLVMALSAICAFAFVEGVGRDLALPLYGSLPFLVWAALRFGSGGASLALTAVAFAAVCSVDRGMGPFLAARRDDNILALQIFVLCTAVPVLYLAAIATARQAVVRLHRAFLSSLHDHVAILDADGTVLEVNESWRRFAEITALPRFHRVQAGDDYLAACRSSADSGHATAASVLAGVTSVLGCERSRCEIEYECRHDGRLDAYTMSIERLARPEGGAVVTRSDVTSRHRAQIEIEDQRNQLSHLTRVAALGQLSGALAHELHQPLTAILSNAEAAQHVLRRSPVDLEYLAVILQDIITDDRRAAAVIDRLRALLKRGERRLQEIRVDELIGEVLDLSRTELITRQVEATMVVDPSLPPIWGDKVQLQQVLLNLVLNGCEAMSGDAVLTDRRLVLTAKAEGDGRVHIAIRDGGVGIAAELMKRLFEPFVTTKPNGLGLGLSISRTIVSAHGGRLWGENNPDGGATIHCQLPIAESWRPAMHESATPAVLAPLVGK